MNVLVTGGNRGIGKAICGEFADKGYTVFAPTRVELDLNSTESLNNFIADNIKTQFDVIICNAGINEINTVENISDEEITSMLQINLISHLKLIRAFVPAMKKNGYGKIINIASIWAVVSKAGRGMYSAVKNALHGLTNTLAIELAPWNIMANTI